MKRFRSMAYPYVFWIAIFIVIPMLLIIAYAFTVEGTAFFQGQFTLDNFARFFRDAVFMQVLLRSMRIAILTTLVCLLLGYPSAYAIARAGVKSTTLILVITLPTWINMLVRTYAWVGILQDNGILNSLLNLLHIGPFPFMYTDFAVVLGMVYNFLPFIQNGPVFLGSGERSRREPRAGVPPRDAAAEHSGHYLRHHAGISARCVLFLHSEAAGRRTVCLNRQRH